jgi:hypothetical protein
MVEGLSFHHLFPFAVYIKFWLILYLFLIIFF